MSAERTPARRTLVKVCGLTRAEDARAAAAAGADWLGFVLNGESPRLVSPEAARTIAAGLAGVMAIGVMVAPSPDEALDLARRAAVARIQLHGVDPASWPEDFPFPASFAVPVAEDGSLTAPLPPEHHLLLLDAAHPALAGGSGRTFPWETARVVAATRPLFLAGGLDGDNVAAAIEAVLPYGVDASSRLESAPGLKDPDKVRLFVDAVRRCDQRIGDRG